jgi:hypothetical protein
VHAFSQRRNRIAGRCPLVCASQRDTTSISGFARQESRLSHAVLKLPPSLVTLHEPPSRRTMLLTEVRLRTIEPEVAFGSLASFWHAPPCLLDCQACPYPRSSSASAPAQLRLRSLVLIGKPWNQQCRRPELLPTPDRHWGSHPDVVCSSRHPRHSECALPST